jgi:hypothetical protein
VPERSPRRLDRTRLHVFVGLTLDAILGPDGVTVPLVGNHADSRTSGITSQLGAVLRSAMSRRPRRHWAKRLAFHVLPFAGRSVPHAASPSSLCSPISAVVNCQGYIRYASTQVGQGVPARGRALIWLYRSDGN